MPSYLSFRGKAQDAAAKSNVRSAIPAAESFYQNSTTGDYTGMSISSTTAPLGLSQLTPGIDAAHLTVTVSTDKKSYCLSDAERLAVNR